MRASPPSNARWPACVLLAELEGAPTIHAVAHRVVHGGQAFKHSVLVDATVLAQLESLKLMAPLHQPHNVAGIRSFQQAFPSLPQVACFDTAFHTSLPEVASAFALPQSLTEQARAPLWFSWFVLPLHHGHPAGSPF